MRRRLRLCEVLEERRLLAANFCVSPPLSNEPDLLQVDQPSRQTQILFHSDEAGAGMYLPANDYSDRDHLADLPIDHALRAPRFGFGRLEDGTRDERPITRFDGAAPNLRVTNTQILRDGTGGFVSSIPVGQMVVMQVNFASEGITGGSPFTVRFDMDGVPIDYVADWVTGDGNWFVWWSGWYASPALHNLSITLDLYNQIAETNEGDNIGSQVFTPYQATTLPEKLIFPTAGIRNRDFAVNNYADMDPRSGQRQDYRNGEFQYDGHNAWDLGPMNFLGQDRGFPILAAAGGVVAEVVDGNFDRRTDTNNNNANYVIIDHGNSWRTIYWHLARDSVTVQVGQVVAAGAVVGEMGSSGISTGTHLHFSLYRNGVPVESMFDADTYYRDFVDVDYQLHTPTGRLVGNISNFNSPVDTDWRESFPSKRVFTRTANDPVVLNFGLSHLNTGETISVQLRRPNGTIRNSSNWTASAVTRFPQFYWWYGSGAWKEQVGTWQWEVVKNGQVLLNEAFEVTDGASPAQIRVRDWEQKNVNPGRTTPFDFGTTLGTQRTFTITNHGDSPLLLGAPVLPAGFSMIGAFPQNIPVGAASSFTVQFDNAFNKSSFGSIRFTTNDPELPEFWFNVEGLHAGTAGDVALLGLPGPDVAYELGAAPKIIDSTATYQSTGPQADMLEVSLQGAAETGDLVAIGHQGFAAGQVGVNGADVSFGGTVVGTIQAGLVFPALLKVQFNAAVTPAAVAAILRSLAFSSTTENAMPRFLRINVVDLAGASSTHGYKGIRIHEPVLILAGVEQAQINDGSEQRSRIQSLQVKFTNEVTLDSSSFVLEKLGAGGGLVAVSFSSQVVFGKTIATLAFTGPFVENDSLIDGKYRLRVIAMDARGVALDGDGDGQAGGAFLFGESANDEFFRFFGDATGDGTVGVSDFGLFRSAFGRAEGQSGYLDAFDFDNNNAVGVADFGAFRTRFGRSI